MQTKKLYRSQKNEILAGVCGGMAEYFDVDPMIMRILFIIGTVFGGIGLLIYIAAWILVPYGNNDILQGEEYPKINGKINIKNIFGVILLFIGFLILIENLNIFSFDKIWDVSWKYGAPILLILLGMAIIYYKQSSEERQKSANSTIEDATFVDEQKTEQAIPSQKIFRRSSTDKKLFGVCGGLANYFSIDSNLVRILYVIFCFASGGIVGIVLYIGLALLVPDDAFINAKN